MDRTAQEQGSETADAIVEIIRASGRCRKNLQTDMGKEFYNADVQKILKKHDVNHYSMYSTLKASSGSIARSKTTCGRYLHLTAITSGSTSCRISYQITTRANIGLSACVTPAIAERLLDTVYSAIKTAGPSKFKMGDSVRMSTSTRRILRRVTHQIGPPRCLQSLRYSVLIL